MRRLVKMCLALAVVGCGAASEPEASEPIGEAELAVGAGTFEEVSGFGSNPGALKMYRYTPSPAPAAGAPLVLAMHACSQNATSYRASGWEEIADEYGFWVVYPEQQSVNNQLGCFNWAGEYGNPANLARGQGENQSIKEMVDKMIADVGVDPARVFSSGHSGGGAQTALLMATWPDVFAAGGIMAGIPYKCTTQYFEVSSCLSPGKNLSPEEWGKRALEGDPGHVGKYPRLSVWHGTNDTLVAKQNQTELIEQWSNVHGIGSTPTSTTMVDGHTRHELKDAGGTTLIESWEISGANHGTFVEPDAGCGTAGQYFIDHGVCAAQRMAEFFGITTASGATSSGAGGGGSGGGAATSGAGAGAGTGGEETACIPGREKICTCEGGGESFKVCADDGSAYGECACNETIQEPSACASSPASGRSPWGWSLVGIAIFFLRRRQNRVARLWTVD